MPVRTFTTEIEIHAPVQDVWSVLSDVVAWPQWTPTMSGVRAVSGERLAVGSSYVVSQPGLRDATYNVGSLQDGTSFTWSTSAVGVKTAAEHILTAVDHATTRVHLGIRMEGPLSAIVWMFFGRKVKQFVVTEAKSLAAVCEARTDEIVPDDKNWTWVLERPCDDCGFDASAFDARGSGDAIRDLAARWSAVLAGDSVQQRPRAGVWSPLEYGCHVRDVFRIFDERLAMMLTEDDPHFANWDQDKTAVDDNYSEQIPAEVSAQLRDHAGNLARRFDSVAGAQWERRGLRSDGSAFTVESIAKYLMHDPVHHLWDVGADIPTY